MTTATMNHVSTPPALNGFTLRHNHTCGRCGSTVRAEYALAKGAARPGSLNIGYWEWEHHDTADGVVLVDRRHVAPRQRWDVMSHDACGFVVPSVAAGNPSFIDQLRASWGNLDPATVLDRVAAWDPDALLASPLVARASDTVGKAPDILLVASAPVARHFFRAKSVPGGISAVDRNLLYYADDTDRAGFDRLTGAVYEPIRG